MQFEKLAIGNHLLILRRKNIYLRVHAARLRQIASVEPPWTRVDTPRALLEIRWLALRAFEEIVLTGLTERVARLALREGILKIAFGA